MKNLFHAAKFLLLDMASTLLFLAVYLWTDNLPLSVAAGMAFGFVQIGWQLVRAQPIDAMQWLSLFLVVASGSAALATNDPRIVMIKPSIIYAIVGVFMLKRGWMNRYLPPVALELAPDVGIVFGFVWSALMFASAGLNIYVALNYDPATWAAFMSFYGIVSKLSLFVLQYAVMRAIGVRRRRAQLRQPAMAVEAVVATA